MNRTTPINILTAKKEPPIIYLFTTVCLKKYQDYKKGTVYEFFRSNQKPFKFFKKAYGDTDYQEVGFKEAVLAYAHRNGAAIDPSEAFHWQLFLPKESKFHFRLLGNQGMYSCKVLRIKKILGLKIKIPTRIVLTVAKELVGSEEAGRLDRELKAKILGPFALLEDENKKVIYQFSESIH